MLQSRAGREFHIVAAATRKKCSPSVKQHVEGMNRVVSSEDQG